MRRESSTVVALVGHVTSDLLAGLARSSNVSVARPPGDGIGKRSAAEHSPAEHSPAEHSPAEHSPAEPAAAKRAARRPDRPGWETAAEAMHEAARRRSMYVIVPADPLADVAASWQRMWDPGAPSPAVARFESDAAAVLAAWRARRFELPDYYLVSTPIQGNSARPDLYLGPLRGVRPRRVSVGGIGGGAVQADDSAQVASLLEALRSLEHGPWWPPLDELLDAARRFYAGGLAETQQLAP